MKSLALVLNLMTRPLRRRDTRVFIWLVVLLVVMITSYSAVFHVIMEREGQQYSWPTAVYWTLVTMSTLGFGDITFESDTGRLFSVVVLVTGAMFILVLLPFAFIQFVFLPWMEQRANARAPRRLTDEVEGHIVVTKLDAVTDALIRKANHAHVPYVLIVPELKEGLALVDQGYRVMVGELDDPDTYRAARVERAALVASTQPDTTNSNIAFTVREINDDVPVAATASRDASVDVLELAGCSEVLRLGQLLGHAMARRVLGGDNRAHIVGEFGRLQVAEASVVGTDLAGQRLIASNLRGRFNVSVAGIWQRGGHFELPGPETVIDESDVLILAGSAEQLAAYDEHYGTDHRIDAPVVVIGGGRVGRAAAKLLGEAGARCRIVEERADRVRDPDLYVLGDAAELDVLREAGLDDATAVLITTHDDDVNVYLTLYCRRLRPELQVIARANVDRNVATLHRAGADAVLSYASIGATAIWNTLGLNDSLVLAEGLEMFQVAVPESMVGKTLIEIDLRRRVGCNIVAIRTGEDMVTNPDPSAPLPADVDLVVIGDAVAQQRFLDAYPVVAGA